MRIYQLKKTNHKSVCITICIALVKWNKCTPSQHKMRNLTWLCKLQIENLCLIEMENKYK